MTRIIAIFILQKLQFIYVALTKIAIQISLIYSHFCKIRLRKGLHRPNTVGNVNHHEQISNVGAKPKGSSLQIKMMRK